MHRSCEQKNQEGWNWTKKPREVRGTPRGWAEYCFSNVHVVKALKNGRKHQKRKHQAKHAWTSKEPSTSHSSHQSRIHRALDRVLRDTAQWLIHVWLSATSWPVACRAPLSMGLSRHAYWTSVPFHSLITLVTGTHEPRTQGCSDSALRKFKSKSLQKKLMSSNYLHARRV